MSESARGALAVAFAATLWGTWRLWLRGPGLDPLMEGAFVLGLSALVGMALSFRRRRVWPTIPTRAWVLMASFGVAEALNSGLYFRSLSHGDVATAAITHYLAPVLVAICSPLLKEPMGKRAPIAAALAFAATAALVGLGQTGPGTKAAAIEGATSAIFYATCIFLSKRASAYFVPWEMVGFHYLIASALMGFASRTPLASASPGELGLLLMGTIVAGTTAAGIYFYGLSRIPAARAGVLGYLEPVSATCIGLFVLHEPIGAIKAGAMGVILLAGVAVATERQPLPG